METSSLATPKIMPRNLNEIEHSYEFGFCTYPALSCEEENFTLWKGMKEF